MAKLIERQSADRFDKFQKGRYICAVFAFLRLPFLLPFVAALVLCGYAGNLVACDLRPVAEDCQHADEQGTAHADCEAGCACVCHQGWTEGSVGLILVPANLALADRGIERGQFPPDAVPRGIDYPPQLA